MIGKNRVVITGLGVLAANGIGKEAFWNSLLAGESGIGPITLFDASDIPNALAGEVSGFKPEDYIDRALKPKKMARFSQLALAATSLAIKDADILDAARKTIVPICMGVSTSATDVIEPQVLRIDKRGAGSASPFTAARSLPQAGAGNIATMLGVESQTITISTGCPAGLDAVAYGYNLIRSGKSDIAIAGGADAPITMLTVATFRAANMLPQTMFPGQKASRPFDQHRDGGVLAEGACVLVLENLEHALSRGANPIAEIIGYASASEAAGDIPGSGLRACMAKAILNAGLMPTDIDYVSAHGPSDKNMDLVETNVIKQVLGDHAYRIPVSSIKGSTGNPLAAAGPLQICSTAMAIQTGIVPPTTNYEVPDPDCDLDYVPQSPRAVNITAAIINNHGLGGGNSSLVIKKI